MKWLNGLAYANLYNHNTHHDTHIARQRRSLHFPVPITGIQLNVCMTAVIFF